MIGRPAWSPDGSAIAFQRDNGIFVATGPGIETQVASIANPSAPAWSTDGKSVAYAVVGVIYTVPADGSAPPSKIANVFNAVAGLAWRPDGAGLAAAYLRGVALVPLAGGKSPVVARASGPGVAYLGQSAHACSFPPSARGCGGRTGIAELSGTTLRQLTNCKAASK